MRRPASWVMLAAAVGVVAGAVLLSAATDDLDRQIRDLDPSESRFEATIWKALQGAWIGVVGLAVFLVAALALAVSASRARRRGLGPASPDTRVLASVATLVVAVALAWVLLAPQGPFQYAAAALGGGGGPAPELAEFRGNLTGAALSPLPPEDVHPLSFSSQTGSVSLRILSGGRGVSTNAVAILETQEESGAWREVARAKGPDQTIEVPLATYPGGLRLRVTLDQGALGSVEYGGAVAFIADR